MRQLFEDALDRDPTTRDAFVAEAAAGDAVLRHEVATLLAALERDDLLENPWHKPAQGKALPETADRKLSRG